MSKKPKLTDVPGLGAKMEEKLECSEPPAERHSPVAELGDGAIRRRLEVRGVGRHHPCQQVDVAHVEQGGVEDGAHPLVGVPRDRVRLFHPIPQMTSFREQHRRARHRGAKSSRQRGRR